MDLGRGSVPSILRRFEQDSTADVTKSLHGHTAYIRRMQCTTVLEGHHGCVNRLALSEDSTLLLSGSDDCNLRVWQIQSSNRASQAAVISPGHYANIFGVAFMPNTNSSYVASAGLDRQVRHTHVETGRSTLWTCHEKMVKTVAPFDTNLFVTASKDGTARMFDARVPRLCQNSVESNVIVRIPGRRRRVTYLNSAVVSPMSSHHLLVAANDSYIRIFDLRFSLSDRITNSRHSRHRATSVGHCIEKFCPPHLHETAPEQCVPYNGVKSTHATYASFSSDAKQIVASYFDDTVHVFDRPCHYAPVSCRPPFMSRAAREYAVWNITQDAARVLQSNYPTMAVGRANRVLEIDPDNIIALLYKAEGLIRRDGAGDFRAAYATLERLIQIIKDDRYRIVELWGSDAPSSPLCFSPDFHSWRDKGEIWLRVFQYMQAFALYQMIPPFQFSMLLRPNSSDRLFTKKRLEHLDTLCQELERYRDEKLGDPSCQPHRFRERVRERALGDGEESERLYGSMASRVRGKILSCLLDRFVSGIDALRERLNDRMSCLLPHHSDSEFPYTGSDTADACLMDSDDENMSHKREDLEVVRDLKEESKLLEQKQENLWGPDLGSEGGCRSFHGHESRQTDIKEASFYGSKNQVVLSGSDDGHVYMWSAKTAELLVRVCADEQIVNCVLGHPHHSMVISSGIDDTIKLITPQGGVQFD